MKIKTIIAAIVSTVVSSQAIAAQPNLFSCVGDETGIEVNYSSSSFTGEPQFSVVKDGENLTPMYDKNTLVNLDFKDSAHGRLVTALVTRRGLMDAPSLVYTLIVPGIQMGDAGEVEFESVLLTGTSGGFQRTPAVYQRLKTVERLNCTAQKVFF